MFRLVEHIYIPMPKTLNLFGIALGNIPTDLCLMRNAPVASKYENRFSNSFLMRCVVKLEFNMDLNLSSIWGIYFGLLGFFVNSIIINLLKSNAYCNVQFRLKRTHLEIWCLLCNLIISYFVLIINTGWFDNLYLFIM